MIAVSRLLLDNVANVKAYWIMMGMPLAAIALHFGANDVQGTSRARGDLPRGRSDDGDRAEDRRARPLRREAGRVPVQRDTLYNELRRW